MVNVFLFFLARYLCQNAGLSVAPPPYKAGKLAHLFTTSSQVATNVRAENLSTMLQRNKGSVTVSPSPFSSEYPHTHQHPGRAHGTRYVCNCSAASSASRSTSDCVLYLCSAFNPFGPLSGMLHPCVGQNVSIILWLYHSLSIHLEASVPVFWACCRRALHLYTDDAIKDRINSLYVHARSKIRSPTQRHPLSQPKVDFK